MMAGTTQRCPAPLDGTRVLVTGAARGIGAHVARRLAARGAAVAIAYRRERDAACRLVTDIEEAGGRAIAIRGDVRDEGDVDALFTAVEDQLGPPEVLVNNAGIHRGGRVGKLTTDDWRAVLDTNLTGAFLCTQRAVPQMLKAGRGRIVNVTSVVGINGFPGDAAYASAKAGLIGLTRALALELASSGINVNAIAPGFVDTDMTRALGLTVRSRLDASVPLGRQAQPEEIAEAVEFLAAGPSYITGSVLVIDGGWTIAPGL